MSGWLLLYCHACDKRFRKRWEDRFKVLYCPHCGQAHRAFDDRPSTPAQEGGSPFPPGA